MEHSHPNNRLAARLARIVPVALIAVFALSLSGCNKDIQTLEAVEGGRIQINELFYQVQLSRILNPKDTEDGYYVIDQPTPAKGEAYFGVFMRVDNETSNTRILPISAERMKIVNASGDEYEPIPVKGAGWSYAPSPLGKGAQLPILNSPAQIGPIGGGLILFKIPFEGLDSRPLRLEIKGPGKQLGEIRLDV